MSALHFHYHHGHACPCNLPHRDAVESGDADAAHQPFIAEVRAETASAEHLVSVGDKQQCFACFWGCVSGMFAALAFIIS